MISVPFGRHVWLASLTEASLTEASPGVRGQVPAEPGELFGSAALTAEEDLKGRLHTGLMLFTCGTKLLNT